MEQQQAPPCPPPCPSPCGGDDDNDPLVEDEVLNPPKRSAQEEGLPPAPPMSSATTSSAVSDKTAVHSSNSMSWFDIEGLVDTAEDAMEKKLDDMNQSFVDPLGLDNEAFMKEMEEDLGGDLGWGDMMPPHPSVYTPPPMAPAVHYPPPMIATHRPQHQAHPTSLHSSAQASRIQAGFDALMKSFKLDHAAAVSKQGQPRTPKGKGDSPSRSNNKGEDCRKGGGSSIDEQKGKKEEAATGSRSPESNNEAFVNGLLSSMAAARETPKGSPRTPKGKKGSSSPLLSRTNSFKKETGKLSPASSLVRSLSDSRSTLLRTSKDARECTVAGAITSLLAGGKTTLNLHRTSSGGPYNPTSPSDHFEMMRRMYGYKGWELQQQQQQPSMYNVNEVISHQMYSSPPPFGTPEAPQRYRNFSAPISDPLGGCPELDLYDPHVTRCLSSNL
ncbi:hypothetical protein HOP50_02g15490 [Chloropicon primus]|uniref:Uncharacterized protein n=1 Tax=Chloropicon primus TaxID=1764295 RepID=A0A5B8MI44_9CHLO|nr:hypothetical protein A3770_02p15580 [Chloropicon primus]UPQ98249.1 hypothetical protein HOP50_02g15490 [Chloropicon primus]|eukprot:QDZ19040.1 hypothetical protein A3770_02p15580 [Chloropicon primus]